MQVKVNPDFKAVNVFWIPQGTDEDDEVQQLLNKTANPLRRELINLRTMGLVPMIYFVKGAFICIFAEKHFKRHVLINTNAFVNISL